MAPHITVVRSVHEMEKIRLRWESLCDSGTTIFQDFGWNLLACRTFAEREEPIVVCAETSYGLAIVPAVVRHADQTVRLLGEELFDYRCLLHRGDASVLADALAELAALHRPLEVIALRGQDCKGVPYGLSLSPFSAAPQVRCTDISPEQFASAHTRLARNLRRLQRLGFKVAGHSGNNMALLRYIYQRKAGQDPDSLFHDPCRVAFMLNAAQRDPEVFEIFTLECGSDLAAALVTLRDGVTRRFYTGWFDPDLEKYSPALSLIYEVTRRSLAAGLDCDYMTGEQPYKMRLATASIPLHRLQATPEQLAALADATAPALRRVG
jgi:CelD/BcsL family acetyltransferase involved in cellulose biosynthesis